MSNQVLVTHPCGLPQTANHLKFTLQPPLRRRSTIAAEATKILKFGRSAQQISLSNKEESRFDQMLLMLPRSTQFASFNGDDTAGYVTWDNALLRSSAELHHTTAKKNALVVFLFFHN